jgi:hypothetical protein
MNKLSENVPILSKEIIRPKRQTKPIIMPALLLQLPLVIEKPVFVNIVAMAIACTRGETPARAWMPCSGHKETMAITGEALELIPESQIVSARPVQIITGAPVPVAGLQTVFNPRFMLITVVTAVIFRGSDVHIPIIEAKVGVIGEYKTAFQQGPHTGFKWVATKRQTLHLQTAAEPPAGHSPVPAAASLNQAQVVIVQIEIMTVIDAAGDRARPLQLHDRKIKRFGFF